MGWSQPGGALVRLAYADVSHRTPCWTLLVADDMDVEAAGFHFRPALFVIIVLSAVLCDGLCGELRPTKTTGADKQVRLQPIVVTIDAYVRRANWLSVGWILLGSLAPEDNDYLVPTPAEQGRCVVYRHCHTTTPPLVLASSCHLRPNRCTLHFLFLTRALLAHTGVSIPVVLSYPVRPCENHRVL